MRSLAMDHHNQLYALSVLPPTIFLLGGHVWLGLLFIVCVVGGRLSRPRSLRSAGRPD